ncbi:telomere repeat binding factor-domain-containing protein [Aspergillus unguis]
MSAPSPPIMVDNRGSGPSIDGQASSDRPASPVLKEEGHHELPKLFHHLEDEDGSLSPRKKRRLETESENAVSPRPLDQRPEQLQEQPQEKPQEPEEQQQQPEQPQEQVQEQPQEQPLDQPQEHRQEQLQEQPKEHSQEHSRVQSQGHFQEQPQERPQEQLPPPHHLLAGAGDQIEEELASALGTGVVDSVEQPDTKNGQIEQGGSPVAQEQNKNIDSDVATVISNIMNHSERVEEQYAMGPQQLPDLSGQGAPKGMALLKANSHLRIQSLPIIDNLSTQILSLLAKSTYQDITSFVSEPESENGQAYATMRSLFDHTKKVYSSKKSFLSPAELEFTEPAQIDTIRKANLASFVSSIFGTQEIGFWELNDHFLDVFVPEGGRLLKQQGALFLELKTQAFIAAMNNTGRTRTELLYILFPDNMEQQLLDRRPGTRQLAPSETDFVNRAGSRRDILLNDVNNEEAMKALPDKYHWEDFLRDLSSYVTKNFDTINNQPKITKGRQPSSSNGDSEPPSAPLQSQFPVSTQAPEVPVDKNMHGDLVARAARAAQIALQGHGLRRSQQQAQQQQQQQAQQQQQQQQQQAQQQQHAQQYQQQQAQQQAQQQQQQAQQQQSQQQGIQILQGYTPAQQQYQSSPAPSTAPSGYQQSSGQYNFQQSPMQSNFQQYSHPSPSPIPGRPNSSTANHGYMPGIPHYSQSQPTQVLYERARMAASAKSSPSSRKSGLPSQRRPWTTEEENALMAGLDRVKGPHWSQILAMFGPGGTISEALKDRNQVQLKDKARNLKLFFLKSGIEVPYYLKFVTGELKTRAPAQAAKREARERQKKQGEEDKAHVEGIKGMMALAGAHPQQVAHGHESMSASPMPPDPNFDQTAEQNLMQTLGKEVHGEQFGQQQHHHPDNMHLGQ